VEGGERYRITVQPRTIPLRDYLRPQGRFQGLSEETMSEMQNQVDRNWARLNQLAKGSRDSLSA
jgi:hypothetical protein